MILYLKFADGFHRMKMDARSDISLNFSHDNLDNPTNYISEYSYNLQVPRCPENNKLFSNFVHLDSVVLAGGYDPTKRMDYVLLDNTGTIISTGSTYIKSISERYYNLSLIGSLSRIFDKLLNSGWSEDAQAEDSEYFLMTDWLKKRRRTNGVAPGTWTNGNNYISRSLVFASWYIDNPLFSVFLPAGVSYRIMYGLIGQSIDETEAFIATVVGFAPTAQGRYKEFDSKSWVESGTVIYLNDPHAASPSVLPVLCSERDGKGEPVQSVEVDDGCIEPQIGEYRSYYQQPYIYVSALWLLYKREFKEITGYELTLDERWYNGENDELSRLVYMLPQLKLDDKILVDNIQMPVNTGGISGSFILPNEYFRSTSYPPVTTIGGLSAKASFNSEPVQCDYGKRLSADITFTINIQDFGYSTNAADAGCKYYFSGFNPFEMVIDVRDSQDNVVATKKCLIYPLPTDGAITLSSMQNDTYINDLLISKCYIQDYELLTGSYLPWGVNGDHRILINANIGADIEQAGDYHIRITFGYHRNVAPFVIKGGEDDVYYFKGYTTISGIHTPSVMKYGVKINGCISEAMRSQSLITLGRLFGEIKPFNVLLQYCKAHHLVWIVDDFNKTVTVKRSTDYYADVAMPIDITNKVTPDKMEIQPLSWDSRKVVFNMSDMGCSYVDGYKDRWGRDYGSKEIITQNEVTKSEKNLLSGDVKASAMLSQTVIPVDGLRHITFNPPAMEIDPMPLNVSDEEQADCNSNFYYRHNNGVWQDEILDKWRKDATGPYVIITDDHPVEVVSGEYCWRGPGVENVLSIPCYVRPIINTVSDTGLSVLFAAVREVYTMQADEPTEYVYERCWKDYVKEVYNAQNKTLRIYARVNKELYDHLRLHPFVTIQNCLYILTSLEGWGEHATTCRLTLRQVHDLTKLTGGATLPIAMEILTEDGEELLCEDDDNLIQE